MRYLRYVFLAALAIVLLTVALANRGAVTLNALPADIAAFANLNFMLTVPLYMVIFASIIAGLMIGFVWEWFREHKHRATATARAREVKRLERELDSLRRANLEPKDEVLALLDRPAKAG
ncbi:LapA family protein (plasmid) [Pseudorhodobacter turbinis]|uniref:LapA family protein n=1 Tax=Pseudorhodobacter turbinis TaxID=2500533 RepID=A0A4P8EL85_9RHOB|nr:LapA family protein [Pseudorhodobacter turbinis]QCO58040.1 LapA family protein [Pseudorhodobacter turbinis]